jgi:hypothetical protein
LHPARHSAGSDLEQAGRPLVGRVERFTGRSPVTASRSSNGLVAAGLGRDRQALLYRQCLPPALHRDAALGCAPPSSRGPVASPVPSWNPPPFKLFYVLRPFFGP